MKRNILLFVLLFPIALSAQNILDIGIFNNPVNSDKLEIRIKPTQTVTSGSYTAGIFTVRFLSIYGVTLTAPPALNNPLFRYSLANQGTDGTYSYYSFSFVSPFTVNWTSGTEYPIAIVQINAGCGSGNGIFEIINNAWTSANNGNVYQELNGIEAENIIYQTTATAPLGVGMTDTTPPTITCPTDKTVVTNTNQCYYTNNGTNWDAIGNDNCPGYSIQYILSGATIDTLFTLNNVDFNKGLTTINVSITDGAGLTATCSFSVTVNDMQVPTITAPAAITLSANAMTCAASGVNLGSPVTFDNCPGIQVTNNAPLLYPLGNTIVTWTVTDAAGLSATATQTVTVQSSLAANAINLSSHQVCIASTVNLSFMLTGGVGPYTVVYSANGNNSTATAYVSNQIITVSPLVTTIFKLVSVTDAIGCVFTSGVFADTLNAWPNPTLSSLLPSAAEVCLGEPVAFTANGLLPNENTTFQYTLLPGGPGVQTVTTTPAGTFTFASATNLPGVYGMSIQSITVNGCTTNFSSGNSGSYTVSPFPTIGTIMPSAPVVCTGTSVYITANGLPPDVNATLQYTINGVPGSQTIQTVGSGTAILLSAIYPEGTYTVVITSVTVAGCSIATNVSTEFTVDPFQAMCGFTIAGKVVTEYNHGVAQVAVTIGGSANNNPFSFTDVTDTLGNYGFINTIPLSSNFTITPVKNDNPLNGLTTYDLVLISKHILGITPLDSPYKLIAADANKSNSVTTFDIVELRKLILGIYQALPSNTSWRFIDKGYLFPNANNPFMQPFPETISATNVQMSALADDFVAIKIGDVNNTVALNARPGEEDRSNRKTLWFDISAPAGTIRKDYIQPGEIFTIKFMPAEQITGYQFTLDIANLEVLGITGSAGMDASNFGVFQDAITTSFFATGPAQTGAFFITFRATEGGGLSHMLTISSRITPAEAYSIDAGSADMGVSCRFMGTDAENKRFELYQNHPNPFTNKTSIGFYLPEATTVSFTVFNAMGQVIFNQKDAFAQGDNNISLNRTQLNATGLLYYTLETPTNAATKKMVLTN